MQKKGLETSKISFSLQKHLFNQYNYWLLRVKSSRESVLKAIKSVNSALGMQLETEIMAKLPSAERLSASAPVSEETSDTSESNHTSKNEVALEQEEDTVLEQGIIFYALIF